MTFINNADEFDQHFLVDNDVLINFIKVCNISPVDTILEIGPGKGVVTKIVAKKAKKVIAIEIDERLKPFHDEIKDKFDNVSFIYGSALDIDYPPHDKIVTSLPYSIVEPFIYKLSNFKNEEVTMIVGKKYADAVVNNEINMLSLLTNCHFKVIKHFDITPESFEPKPRVMSSVITLKSKDVSEIENPIIKVFRWLFYYKDKKIKNGLVESLIKSYEDLHLTQRMCRELINGINESILENKFETCSNEDLKDLYNAVVRINDEKIRC